MLFAIALGGAVGSMLRYGLVGHFQRASADGFPHGTLLVNITGSFLLGVLARSIGDAAASPELRAGLTIGLCGGFTTFSAFSHETVMLLEHGSHGRALAYVLASVVLSVLAMVAGLALGRAISAG